MHDTALQHAKDTLARIARRHPPAETCDDNTPHFIIGYLTGTLEALVFECESIPRWTRCADAMPPAVPDSLNDSRHGSAYVLVREWSGTAPKFARWTFLDGDEDGGQWIQQGRDGYVLDGITEWLEVRR